MALKSVPGLLAAIEGYKGETAGSGGHEDIHALLDRVVSEVKRGTSTPQDSPGRREAASAASAAYQRNHPSEHAHSSGDGQVRSAEPGSAHEGDPAPDIAGPQGNEHDKIRSSGPVRSQGDVRTVAPSGGFSGPDAAIRRAAADRELSRPDTKIGDREDNQRPGGNRESVAAAPPARESGRTGNVSAPNITNTQKAGDTARAGKEAESAAESGKGLEDFRPARAQENVGTDEDDHWGRASAKAKARLVMKAAARS